MARFNAKEKLAAVNRALKGNESYLSIAQLIGTNDKSLYKWINNMNTMGLKLLQNDIHTTLKRLTWTY